VSDLQSSTKRVDAKKAPLPEPDPLIEVHLVCGHGMRVSSFFISDPFKKIPGEFCEHCAAGEPGWGGRQAA
jgi:hypothetical protein